VREGYGGREGRLEREKAAGYGDVCLFLVFSLSLSKLLLIWLSHSDLSSFFWAACGVGVGHSLRAMAFLLSANLRSWGWEGREGGRHWREGVEGVGFFLSIYACIEV